MTPVPPSDASPEPVPLFTGPIEDPTRYRLDPADIDAAIAGGEGLLYQAHHQASGTTVALKVHTGITTDGYPKLAERAATLSNVCHPNLMEQRETFLGCPLTTNPADTDHAEFDIAYSVATWIDGQPLTTAADSATIERKLAWIRDLAAAIHELHTHRAPDSPDGIVHRDIKPSNIRITPDDHAILVDFGLARPLHPTDMTQGAGTYLWRAPEVLHPNTPIGPAADTWALGATAHWLLTGQPPPPDGAAAAYERLGSALRDAGSPDPASIAGPVATLLESRPSDRPSDLTRWASELGAPRRRSRARLIGALGVGLVAIVAFTGLWATSRRPETSSQRSNGTPAVTLTSLPGIAYGVPIRCAGSASGELEAKPPLVETPQDVTYTLSEPTGWLGCTEGDNPVGNVWLSELSFAIPDFGCGSLPTDGSDGTSPATPVSGRGTGIATWSAGGPRTASSSISVVVTLDSLTSGVVLLDVLDGQFRGYSGTGSVSLGNPEGDCGSGIAGVVVEMASLTLDPGPSSVTGDVVTPPIGQRGSDVSIRFLDPEWNLVSRSAEYMPSDGLLLEYPNRASIAIVFAGDDDPTAPPPDCALVVYRSERDDVLTSRSLDTQCMQ